jgi:triosephosphate isomerase
MSSMKPGDRVGRVPLIVANWKMNLLEAEAQRAALAIAAGAAELHTSTRLAVAPSFPALATVRRALAGSTVWLAAQNVHWEDRGAFTGEVSARMLVEQGVHAVLVGHSERRHILAESDDWVARKTVACLRAGLVPLVCVGETEAERDAGQTRQVVSRQVLAACAGLPANAGGEIVFAYEPVWAIGTGRNATPEQAAEVHALVRRILRETSSAVARDASILYGGSVTPENAASLLALEDVDGALVGGASLDPERFLRIAASARA